MIEERAVVIEAGKGYVWVETQRQTVCGSCNVNTACGCALLSNVLGKRCTRIQALTAIPLRIGDEVIIGVSENALLKSSLTVYMVPLLLMFLGALLADSVFSTAGEAMAFLLGGIGLAAGFAWLRIFTWGSCADSQFHPKVLRRLESKRISAPIDL